MKNRKFFKIMIAGGLGNQLFIYFAGLCLATEKNYKLKVDLLYRALHHSKFDLTSFVLPGEFIPRNKYECNILGDFIELIKHFNINNFRKSILIF